jgi:hypothetical protein
MSRRKMSQVALVSPAIRLAALLDQTTQRPSPERAGLKESPLPAVPPVPTLTSSVVPARRSRR